jgi:hypothetical protein
VWWLDGADVPLIGRLTDDRPTDEGLDHFDHRATVGTRAGLSWGAGSEPNGLARDLRSDEAFGPTYTSEPLTEPVSILGIPVALLEVEATAPIATVVVRLTDVAPAGTSGHVSVGALNLTHRESHSAPSALKPGRRYEVSVPMRASGYGFAVGHRLRLSVSSGYWPVLWPSPLPCILTVHSGGPTRSRLVLPVIPGTGGEGDLKPPGFAPPPSFEAVGGGSEELPTWQIVEDVIAGTVSVQTREAGTTDLPDGRSLFSSEELAMTTSDADPAHATLATMVVYRWREHDFATEIIAEGTIGSDAEAFDIDLELRVRVDEEPFFERRWRERIARRLI